MIDWPQPETLEASDHQREKYATIANSGSRIAILEGGPGTGKSYTTASIVKAILANHQQATAGLAAPTGKAAIRLTELMREHGVGTGAATIHRLLGVTKTGGSDEWCFTHNAINPLPYDFIAIDEASMLSTSLAANLFSAIDPKTLVLLIGDTGQLLPVGHGAPLRDMLAAGVPSAKLTEVRRNAGDVALACQAIAKDGSWRPSEGRSLENGQNWWHIESRSGVNTQKLILKLLANVPSPYTVEDVQIICTVNRNSPLSREVLNFMIAPVVNPRRVGAINNKIWFAENDKVMCLKNGYYTALEEVEDEELSPNDNLSNAFSDDLVMKGDKDDGNDNSDTHFIANGEIGYVLECKPGVCEVKFEGPTRIVRFAGESMKSLTLAYVITTHKSQGSGWPIVIMPIDDHSSAQFMSCRELIYTGLSRMEKLVITIGPAGAAKMALRKVAIQNRKTFLKEEILK